MKHVFIIGSRGLPAQYGGFETFVEQLVLNRKSSQICYHVACLSDSSHGEHSEYAGVDCFTIKPPKLGPASVIAYDMMAISHSLKMVKEQGITNPIFYVLGNTIGVFMAPFAAKIHGMGGKLFVNPDGLEWKRSKWSRAVRFYLKCSEKAMTRHADLIIADNEGIESYLKESYPWSQTTFIAYGTDVSSSQLQAEDSLVRDFFTKWQIKEKEYYLVVGRFVSENNYATIIREFRASKTDKKLVVVCNHEGCSYFEKLKKETRFDRDNRIQFVGTIYEKELLKYLRQEARAYIHGHEVGGTNPSLLEALAQTNDNLVLSVDFNKKVALDTARYWCKQDGSLSGLINEIDAAPENSERGKRAKEHMKNQYSWEKIVRQYEDLFLK